ncbi:hypothetical protein POG14_05105 [Clostridium paraputrificum]|uniref:hypothetical protein n=1 Tax=Clostridium paraputrificum TaxID=29363 RepID=UPI0018974D0E|nr:hypothetical protein [Clostridium paraputrificum]MDC0801553.1 hypothetical protein [Clostridium paraputrificum]
MNVNDKAIKEKIRVYREQRVLKATALRKLRKEFGVSENVLDEFWLEVKQEKKVTNSTAKKKKLKTEPKKEDSSTSDIQAQEDGSTCKEDKYINKDLKVVKKVVTVAGKYDVYEKDGTNVKGSTLDFSTPEDVNKWRNKLLAEEDEIFLKEKEKYSKRKEAINQRMDEVLDVMLMEV